MALKQLFGKITWKDTDSYLVFLSFDLLFVWISWVFVHFCFS